MSDVAGERIITELRKLYDKHVRRNVLIDRDDPAGAVFSMLLAARNAVLREIETRLTSPLQSRSQGRGRLRRELRLTWQRLAAFSRRKGREEVLERVLIWLMPDRNREHWWNQFCPAAGLCGGNRTAVDI